MASENDPVLLEWQDDIAVIELNRPAKLNAVTPDMAASLVEMVDDLYDRSVKGLLFTGRGRATCAGMDLDGFKSGGDEYVEGVSPATRKAGQLIRELPVPTVMAAKGATVGGGFTLSLSFDYVIMGDATNYSFTEITLGLAVSRETVELLLGFVNPRMAKEIVGTGEPLSPDRALELGLVNRVVPEAEVDAAAREFIESVTDVPSQEAVAELKQHFLEATEAPSGHDR